MFVHMVPKTELLITEAKIFVIRNKCDSNCKLYSVPIKNLTRAYFHFQILIHNNHHKRTQKKMITWYPAVKFCVAILLNLFSNKSPRHHKAKELNALSYSKWHKMNNSDRLSEWDGARQMQYEVDK